MMNLVNNNKGIKFEDVIYVYESAEKAKDILNQIELVSKFKKVNVHKVLFDTCVEITDICF